MDKRLHLEEEAARCLLCADAPCSKVCKNGDPARTIRAIRFGNEKLAGRWVDECTDEDLEAAEKACIHYDRPIRIKEMLKLINSLTPAPSPREEGSEYSQSRESAKKGIYSPPPLGRGRG